MFSANKKELAPKEGQFRYSIEMVSYPFMYLETSQYYGIIIIYWEKDLRNTINKPSIMFILGLAYWISHLWKKRVGDEELELVACCNEIQS